MFRRNGTHQQEHLISDLDHLGQKHRMRLADSWAGVFYREFFCRLDERPFAVLYSQDEASRPNIAVNVLIGLEALKAGFGWSDADMYDAFIFDLQVRYALGYHNLGEGDFELRSVYNFRRRLTEHMLNTGENLLDRALVQITDVQIHSFQLSTRQLRMDSTQIASNIQQLTRLQLLVEVLQRVYRMLAPADQERHGERFAPYLKGSAGQYTYHLRDTEHRAHVQAIGELMQHMVTELAVSYAEDSVYLTLRRVFREQFCSGADGVQVIPAGQVSSHHLCSPDDPEATFCRKGQSDYEGYVTNVTETCEPGNPFQLIVKVQTEPNITSDSALLVDALPDLKRRTGVETLYNDATFCSRAADLVLRQHEVIQVPTGLRGQAPHPHKLNLSHFHIRCGDNDQPRQVTCPHGQTVTVHSRRNPHNSIAYFTQCQTCPLQPRCQTHVIKRDERRSLYFTRYQMDAAERRQRCAALHRSGRNPRAAIEATLGAIKHPFSDDQLPVRGHSRVAAVMLGAAAMFNVRRIHRYLSRIRVGSENPASTATPGESALGHFCFALRTCIQALLAPVRPPVLAFAFAW